MFVSFQGHTSIIGILVRVRSIRVLGSGDILVKAYTNDYTFTYSLT